MPSLGSLASDPTMLFTLSVVLVPLVFTTSVAQAVAYLTTPMMLASFAYLFLVLYATHSSGPCVELSARDKVRNSRAS